ncbi:hypothetical protein GW17_00034921 [Ensete ventricosum]|nr:hypothetical protein GW17_00034921 [Ensete ventricosum]
MEVPWIGGVKISHIILSSPSSGRRNSKTRRPGSKPKSWRIGQVSYEYENWVTLACFRARYPQLEIEEDPYATLPRTTMCRWRWRSPLTTAIPQLLRGHLKVTTNLAPSISPFSFSNRPGRGRLHMSPIENVFSSLLMKTPFLHSSCLLLFIVLPSVPSAGGDKIRRRLTCSGIRTRERYNIPPEDVRFPNFYSGQVVSWDVLYLWELDFFLSN